MLPVAEATWNTTSLTIKTLLSLVLLLCMARLPEWWLTIKPLIQGTSCPKTEMFLISSCSCLCPIHWSQVLSREWRCSWNRRGSNYICVVGAAPTGAAPTTSEWSTILLPAKVRPILEVWWYLWQVFSDDRIELSRCCWAFSDFSSLWNVFEHDDVMTCKNFLHYWPLWILFTNAQ